MRESSVQCQKNLMSAAVVAVLLLVGSGAGFRVLAQRLSRPNESSPIPPGTLETFPMEVGDWIGRDIVLDERVVVATDTDDHLNRRYVLGSGQKSAGLYIAYGVQARDLMPHRPEVCYPAQGWTLDESDREDVSLSDGTALPCQVLRFVKGGLSKASRTVLYYYIIDGSFFADVSSLRNRSLWGSSHVRYVAQVQVTSTGGHLGGRGDGMEHVRAFAAETALLIRKLLPHEGSDGDEVEAGGTDARTKGTS